MLDRDNKPPVTVETFGQELLHFVQNAEFGTPKYIAVSDYVYLIELHSDISEERRSVLDSKGNRKERLARKSQLHITEMQIALLQNEIRHNQSRLEGYSAAYTNIEKRFDEFGMLAADEAYKLHPDDEEEIIAHIDKAFAKIVGEVNFALLEKEGDADFGK